MQHWDSGKLTRLSPFSLCTVIWMITSHIDKTIWNSLIVLCHFFRESNARSQVRSTFYKNYLHWLITTCILKLTKSYWSFYVWPNWIELNALRTWGNKPWHMPSSGHNPITTYYISNDDHAFSRISVLISNIFIPVPTYFQRIYLCVYID